MRKRRSLFLLLTAVFLLLSVGHVHGNGWESYQGDDRNTGHVNATVPENVTEDWVFSTNGSVASSSVVVNDTVYFGSIGSDYADFLPTVTEQGAEAIDGRIHSINATTGDENWNVSTPSGVWSTPAHEDGNLYVASAGGTVYRLNASSGEVEWEFEAGEPVLSSPKVEDGTLYIGTTRFDAHRLSEDGRRLFYALNTSDGSVVWKHGVEQGVFAPPAVRDGAVYVGDQNGTFYSMNTSDGDVRWSYETQGDDSSEDALLRFGGVTSAPTVVDSRIYFGSYNGILYTLNSSGYEVWRTNLSTLNPPSPDDENSLNGTLAASAGVRGGTLYVGGYGNAFHSIDTQTGEPNWVYETYLTKPSPAVGEETVVAGINEGVLGLNVSNGAEVWSFPTRSRVISSPAVVNGEIYFTDIGGNVHKLVRGERAETNGTQETEETNETQEKLGQNTTVSERVSGPGVPNPSDRQSDTGPVYLLFPLAAGFVLIGLLGLAYRRMS